MRVNGNTPCPKTVSSYVVDAGFKYRYYPTEEQENYLARTFGCVRVVYNRALDARKKHYQAEGKGLSYGKTSALLTQWKKEEGYRWLSEVSSVPLQQTLRHLGTAFQRFFTADVGGKKAGYPRYKSRHDKQSATFVKSGFRLSGDLRQPQVQLPKMAEPLSVRAWVCDGCGVVHDRDVNAALNVKAVGLAVLASGLSVRPVAALSVAGGSG